MPESNPNTGECSGRNLQKEIATNAEGFNLFLAAVGGGRSDCIDVESVCWLAVYLAFALHGLAHFSRSFICRTTNTHLWSCVDTLKEAAILFMLFKPGGAERERLFCEATSAGPHQACAIVLVRSVGA